MLDVHASRLAGAVPAAVEGKPRVGRFSRDAKIKIDNGSRAFGEAIEPSDRASAALRPRRRKDLEIPMRDGARLRRRLPSEIRRTFPAIINLGSYQKGQALGAAAGTRGEAERVHELGDGEPAVVVPRGYTCVRVDGRGPAVARAHRSLVAFGSARLLRCDRMDGKQSWCNGRVGMNGISYYAMTQAGRGTEAASLAAMIPWEGAADMYRDSATTGGIFSFGFASGWWNNHMAHPSARENRSPPQPTPSPRPGCGNTCASTDGAWWEGRRRSGQDRRPAWYSAGNGAAWDLHPRGTPGLGASGIEAQEAAHPRGHALPPFYSEEDGATQLRFFDQWLKGEDTGIMDEPPVKLSSARAARELRVERRTGMAARTHEVDKSIWRGNARPRAPKKAASVEIPRAG